MDLRNYVPKEDTIVIPLVFKGEQLKNKDGSDMTITVYGPWTKKYRASGFNLASKRLRNKNEDTEVTYEDFNTANIELLASITYDWNITLDGKKPELTTENAIEVYDEIYWIKPLIEEAINKSGDFPLI